MKYSGCMYFPRAICIGKLLAFVASNWQIVASTCYFWSLTNWKASEQHIAWNSSRHSPEFCLNYEKFQHTYYPYRKFHNTLWRTFLWHLARGIPGVWQKRPTAAPGVENLALGPATTWRWWRLEPIYEWEFVRRKNWFCLQELDFLGVFFWTFWSIFGVFFNLFGFWVFFLDFDNFFQNLPDKRRQLPGC